MLGLLIIIMGTMLVTSAIALELEFTTPFFEPITAPSGIEAPEGNALSAIINALQWAFNVATSFFQFLTFQIEGLPAVFSLVFVLFTLIVLYILLRLIRGGG